MNKTKSLAWIIALAIAVLPLGISAAAPRCYPKSRFVVLPGGLVRDAISELMWQRDGSGTRLGSGCDGTRCTWAGAKAYCATLRLDGLSGFRLPTIKELSSLRDGDQGSWNTDPLAILVTPAEWFWTSSPYAGLPGNAWYVNFSLNSSNYYGVDSYNRVRCVR